MHLQENHTINTTTIFISTDINNNNNNQNSLEGGIIENIYAI